LPKKITALKVGEAAIGRPVVAVKISWRAVSANRPGTAMITAMLTACEGSALRHPMVPRNTAQTRTAITIATSAVTSGPLSNSTRPPSRKPIAPLSQALRPTSG
jgi:threonine/homoserine efflux transporter RhtA